MKKGNIARIVIWGLVALLLIGVLAFLLIADDALWYRKSDDTRESFGSSGADRAVTNLDGVREIEIEWTKGEVKIVPTDGDLRFYEDYSGEEKYQMVYRIDGNTLKIDICEKRNWPFFTSHLPKKTLTVELPREVFDRIDVEAVSAKVSAQDVSAGELDVETASGAINLSGCAGTGLNAESTSGAIDLSGCAVAGLDAESTSGAISIFSCTADGLDADSTSGAISISACTADGLDAKSTSGTITISDCEAAELKLDSTSGKIEGEALKIGEAQASTTSGAVTLSFARCRSFDGETVSGRMNVAVFSDLQKADLDTTSGAMCLTVPDGAAANVQWNAVSGSLHNNTLGSTAVQVRADSVSGDLTIENAAKE